MKIALLSLLSCIIVLLFVSSTSGSCKRSLEELEGMSTNTTIHQFARATQFIYNYASSAPRQPSTSGSLKFMTFNMQSGFLTSCTSDVNQQANFIKSLGVDFLASEEIVQGVTTRCNCNMPQIIANVAGMSTRFAMAIPYGTGFYGTMTATSQIILETRNQQLIYSGIEQRIVAAVRTQPAVLQGRNLWFVTCHVDYYSTAGRYSQISQILTFVAGITSADPQAVVVLGGDFNGGPWDQGYTMIKNAGFTNAWENFAGSIEGGNTIPAGSPGSRFDHVWFKAPSGVTIRATQAVVPNVLLSDHRPFVATLTFTVGGSAPNTPAPTSAPPTAATTKPTSAPVTSAPAATPAPAGQVVCVGPYWEGATATIKCPLASQTMRTTMYANFGFNSGTCGNFQKGSCVGGSSVPVVNSKCIGKNSCSFPVALNVFGDPCPGNAKTFYAQVLCQ